MTFFAQFCRIISNVKFNAINDLGTYPNKVFMFAFFGLVSKLSAPLKLKNKFSPFIAHELFSTKFSQSELLKAGKLQTPTDIGQMLKKQLKPWLTQYVWNF